MVGIQITTVWNKKESGNILRNSLNIKILVTFISSLIFHKHFTNALILGQNL